MKGIPISARGFLKFARRRRLMPSWRNMFQFCGDFRASFKPSIVLMGALSPAAVLAQTASPAVLLNPQAPVRVAIDAQYVGSTMTQVTPLPGSVPVAIAQKYSNEPKVVATVVTAPRFPSSAVPKRMPFQPAPPIPMGQPVVNPTYQPNVVNEPMVDPSQQPPFQMPPH